MNRYCDQCGRHYDDAIHMTFCPHEEFMTAESRSRKDLAISLIGKNLCFHHQAKTGPVHRIVAVSFEGFVTLADMDGEFNPDLFVVAP